MQEDLLSKLVYGVLAERGFDKLAKEEQDKMLPQFVSALERRLGVDMLPYLTEESAEEFAGMVEKDTGADEWYAFWIKNVPEFEEKAKKSILEFAEELRS